VLAGGDALGVVAGLGVGDHHGLPRVGQRSDGRFGQVGLGPRGDEPGDPARLLRVADGVVGPVERDERLGVADCGEDPAGLACGHDRVGGGVQDEERDPRRRP
jgi:hypothetical protein